MAVIGIICCEVLELEFCKLLGEDVEIGRISVIEDRQSMHLLELLEAKQVRGLSRLPHVHAFSSEPGIALEVILRVLQIELHRNRAVLRSALSKAAHEFSPHIDAMLLGYGLCGDPLSDPRAFLEVEIPVFLPMDQGHLVDDCVALCLGGRERYYAEQRKVPGTFFLTPGWSQHWKLLLAGDNHLSSTRMRRVLSGYERALAVKTPAISTRELLRNGREFCLQAGLRLELCPGTMGLLTEAWNAAKQFLRSKLEASERRDIHEDIRSDRAGSSQAGVCLREPELSFPSFDRRRLR